MAVVRWGIAIGILAVALALGGCGDTGASQEELANARERGEKAGRFGAQEGISGRLSEAHGNGFWEGWEKGVRKGKLKGRTEAWKEVELIWREEESEAEEEGFSGDAYEGEPGPINPYPIKENGEPSYEFEPGDLERAENAPESVQEYCAGAVSEAQEVGCLSHVNPWEVP